MNLLRFSEFFLFVFLSGFFNELFDCSTEPEGKALLEDLSKLNKPLEITFQEILKLMRQCEQVDKINEKSQRRNRGEIIKEQNTNLQSSIFPKSPLSLLNGIIPGEFIS